jgi:Uma2 family endonuclease
MEPQRQYQGFTADDLYDLPEESGEHYELIDGTLYVSEPPGVEHGAVGSNIAYLIADYAQTPPRPGVDTGDPGFLTRGDNRTVRGPDACFISYQRLPAGELPRGFGTVPPELVVEVLSPSDVPREVRDKAKEWLAFGVTAVWLVDPTRRRVEVWEGTTTRLLTDADSLDGGKALPGFRASIAAFFED